MMSVVKFDETAAATERDPKMRALFEGWGGGKFDASQLDQSDAQRARPFVSPMVWATYTAIVAVTMHGVLRWIVLKEGLGPKIVNTTKVAHLVKAVLPTWGNHVDMHGDDSYYNALDALDRRLIEEFRVMLEGHETDAETVRRADNILKQAQALMSANVSSQATKK
jgi:hypothetical protein